MRRERALAASLYGAALALAYAVKRFYSGATAEDLELALGPTTYLVERLTGETFSLEPGVGYVSPALGLAIVPGCAGLNFMIVLFLALVFGFGGRVRGASGRVALFFAAAGVAYVATLAVNAARIVASQRVFERLVENANVGFDEVHRVVGIVVYVGALFALVGAAERIPALRRATR